MTKDETLLHPETGGESAITCVSLYHLFNHVHVLCQ